MAGVASFFACFCWLLPCFALLFLSLCCFDMLCLVEPILNLKSSLPALVCLALSFFALLCLAWPCFALVCLALPCLVLLPLALPYFTHALSVPLLLRFSNRDSKIQQIQKFEKSEIIQSQAPISGPDPNLVQGPDPEMKESKDTSDLVNKFTSTNIETKNKDNFDSLEVFEMIRHLNDPEHPLTLEQLHVTTLENIDIVKAVLVAETYQLLSPALTRRGGSIFLSGKTTTTAHNLFMKNGFNEASDVYRGGGIYIGEMATMHVEGINCISMYASDDGACIYITDSAVLNIVDGNIVRTANISSAVAAVGQSSLSWDQKISDEYDYTNNRRVTVKQFALNITGVSFLENRGRALRVFSSTARLTDCSFTNDGYSKDTRTHDV